MLNKALFSHNKGNNKSFKDLKITRKKIFVTLVRSVRAVNHASQLEGGKEWPRRAAVSAVDPGAVFG